MNAVSKPSYKHLSVLRKALSKAHTGDIIFETNDERGKISVTVGDLINDQNTVHELEKLLSQPIVNCELISERIEESVNQVDAPAALTDVLNRIHWNTETLHQLRETFAKLPPINVRMTPLHKYGYNDGLTYLMLYQESLIHENFTAVNFFNNCPQYTTLEQQVKVLLLGYCLGLINPDRPKKKSSSPIQQKRANVASRILNKIRGM